jgi:two-component system, LuxR family, response regulator FixJ
MSDSAPVFVVDDDEAVADGLVMLLTANGYTARSFPSAEAFLADRPAASWHCGLVDVHLPGMDGLALAETLHAQGAPPPQLLVMTGRITTAVEQRAAAAGLPPVLSKPLDMPELLAAVSSTFAA